MQIQKSQHFSFKYVVNLGEKIGNIFINEHSDPYVEASQFCAKFGLPTIIITILGDQIAKEIQGEKHRICREDVENQSCGKNRGVLKEKSCQTQPKTLQTEQRQSSSCLNQEYYLKHSMEIKRSKALLSEKTTTFDNLYNDHQEIQKKKQLQRKRSFEKFPFRPQINTLSDHIVSEKRKLSILQKVDLHPNKHSNCSQQNRPPLRSTSKQQLDKSKETIYQRSQRYLSKSIQKKQKIRKCIEEKMMQQCTFRPKVGVRWR